MENSRTIFSEIAELSPERSVDDLVSAVREYATDQNILLVGHEPLLSRTVSFLVSGSTEMEVRLKKGGLCCLELRPRAAKEKAILHWSLAPKHLRRLAR